MSVPLTHNKQDLAFSDFFIAAFGASHLNGTLSLRHAEYGFAALTGEIHMGFSVCPSALLHLHPLNGIFKQSNIQIALLTPLCKILRVPAIQRKYKRNPRKIYHFWKKQRNKQQNQTDQQQELIQLILPISLFHPICINCLPLLQPLPHVISSICYHHIISTVYYDITFTISFCQHRLFSKNLPHPRCKTIPKNPLKYHLVSSYIFCYSFLRQDNKSNTDLSHRRLSHENPTD